MTVMGDAYALGPVEVVLQPTSRGQTATVKTLHLKRKAGGALDIAGKVALAHQDLDLDVVIDRLPLAGLPGVAEAGVPVSGFASAKLHVGGRPESPRAGRRRSISRRWCVRGIKLGAGHLALSPAPVGPRPHPRRRRPRPAVRSLRRRRAGGAGAQGAASFTPRSTSGSVEIEALAPELVEFGDARGIVSGRVTRRHRSGAPAGAGSAASRAVAVGRARRRGRERRDDRPARARRGGAPAARQRAAATASCSTRRTSRPTAAISGVAGRLDGKAISGKLSGHLDLELLQPFLGAASPARAAAPAA